MSASSLVSDEKPDGGSKVEESQRDTFLAERRVAASRLLREFPDYVPTMLWLGGRMRAEGRLLVARALCVGHVTLLLRPLLRLGPLAAAPLFLWARGRPLPPLASFRFLYEQYAERDGFLHLLMSDLGDPLVEQRAPPPQSTEVASPTLTIAAAAASAAAATATARPPVVFWPPELARSYRGRLRYPSPPEPDEQVLSHAHTDLQRERSDISEASMASGPSASSGVASALLVIMTICNSPPETHGGAAADRPDGAPTLPAPAPNAPRPPAPDPAPRPAAPRAPAARRPGARNGPRARPGPGPRPQPRPGCRRPRGPGDACAGAHVRPRARARSSGGARPSRPTALRRQVVAHHRRAGGLAGRRLRLLRRRGSVASGGSGGGGGGGGAGGGGAGGARVAGRRGGRQRRRRVGCGPGEQHVAAVPARVLHRCRRPPLALRRRHHATGDTELHSN